MATFHKVDIDGKTYRAVDYSDGDRWHFTDAARPRKLHKLRNAKLIARIDAAIAEAQKSAVIEDPVETRHSAAEAAQDAADEAWERRVRADREWER